MWKDCGSKVETVHASLGWFFCAGYLGQKRGNGMVMAVPCDISLALVNMTKLMIHVSKAVERNAYSV